MPANADRYYILFKTKLTIQTPPPTTTPPPPACTTRCWARPLVARPSSSSLATMVATTPSATCPPVRPAPACCALVDAIIFCIVLHFSQRGTPHCVTVCPCVVTHQVCPPSPACRQAHRPTHTNLPAAPRFPPSDMQPTHSNLPAALLCPPPDLQPTRRPHRDQQPEPQLRGRPCQPASRRGGHAHQPQRRHLCRHAVA